MHLLYQTRFPAPFLPTYTAYTVHIICANWSRLS